MSVAEAAARWRSKEQAGAVHEGAAQLRTERLRLKLEEPVEPRTPINEASAKILAGFAWKLLDFGVCRFFGKQYGLTKSERMEIVTETIPVVQLYVPELPGGDLFTHPLAALGITAGTIYAAKVMGPELQPVPVQKFEKPTNISRPAEAPVPRPTPVKTSTPGMRPTNTAHAAIAAAFAGPDEDEEDPDAAA